MIRVANTYLPGAPCHLHHVQRGCCPGYCGSVRYLGDEPRKIALHKVNITFTSLESTHMLILREINQLADVGGAKYVVVH